MGLLVLSLATAFTILATPESGLVWNPNFGRAEIWNDGNAEVSAYEARDIKYGIPRTSRTVLIVVAEDLSPEKLVKADRPSRELRTRRVLKLNHVRSIPTGVYVYQQMLSVFLGVDRLEPVKLTMSSHEWCGNTFVEWRSDRNLLSLRSYFEAVADQDLSLDTGPAVFYDSLPLKLRAIDFSKTTEGRLPILDTLFAAAPRPPTVREAHIRVQRSRGRTERIEVLRAGERDLFEFETAPPHRLLRWERSDGGLLTLLDSRRFRYWEKDRPGDESLLPPVPAR